MGISTNEIKQLDQQINQLKAKRDKLIKDSGLEAKQLERILAFRTPTQTICQLLRELHDELEGEQQEKVGQCLLIAKKMDRKLMGYAGRKYSESWYNEKGEFKDATD